MKKALILAAPLVALLAACAAPAGNTNRVAAAAPASGAQYCMKDRLFVNGDEMSCNWAASAADACENPNLSSLSKSRVAGAPAGAGRCGNGQWLVTVTPKA